MSDLDYVLVTIDPWLTKYIARGSEVPSDIETIGVGVGLLEAEVNNGGHDQHFFNSRGVLPPDISCFFECETSWH